MAKLAHRLFQPHGQNSPALIFLQCGTHLETHLVTLYQQKSPFGKMSPFGLELITFNILRKLQLQTVHTVLSVQSMETIQVVQIVQVMETVETVNTVWSLDNIQVVQTVQA